jgi:hypothetical protein
VGPGQLRTVVKHEAVAVRPARLRLVGATEIDLDAREAIHLSSPDELIDARGRAHRSLTALAALKATGVARAAAAGGRCPCGVQLRGGVPDFARD